MLPQHGIEASAVPAALAPTVGSRQASETNDNGKDTGDKAPDSSNATPGAARIPEICGNPMARRLQDTSLKLVAPDRFVPAFLKARSGVAVLVLARIDPDQAIAHIQRLAARCEAIKAAAGVANNPTEANRGDAG
jgi:hypothetical protein